MSSGKIPQILTRGASLQCDSGADDTPDTDPRREHAEQHVRILQSHSHTNPSQSVPNREKSSSTWLNSIVLDGRLAIPRKMTQPVKLVDPKWHWSAEPVEFLTENMDFLVVSIVGSQGVGKSFIASLLAGCDASQVSEQYTFKTEDAEKRTNGHHETVACDLFVTPERIIVIDNQPLMSQSVLDEFIHYDRKIAYEYPSFESCVLMQSLQMFCFNCTISHVIVHVFDHFIDETALSIIQTGEMIKPDPPSMLGPSSADTGYEGCNRTPGWPRLIFLYNKCPSSLMNFSCYTNMQRVLHSRFELSKFNFKDGCGSKILPLFCAASGAKTSGNISDNVNLLLLPDHHTDPIGFRRASSCVRSSILSSPRIPFYTNEPRVPMSELTWHQFSTKTWEGVKRSKLFDEYTKLLP